MIFTRNLLIALCATFVAFATLYIPQPMLPLLANQFGVSSSEAGLLMTATLLPLGLAPVVYGYFLQAIPARLMLTVALVLLMFDQLAFYIASEFWHLILLRGDSGITVAGHIYRTNDLLRKHGSAGRRPTYHGVLYCCDRSGRIYWTGYRRLLRQ